MRYACAVQQRVCRYDREAQDLHRQTVQRIAIAQVIGGAERPLSAEDVLARARASVPSLDRSTVYRNLKAMAQEGTIRKVVHPELGALYELASKAHHHHFYCRECDQVFELPGCALDVSGSTPPGFQTYSHEVFLYGACPECSNNGP